MTISTTKSPLFFYKTIAFFAIKIRTVIETITVDFAERARNACVPIPIYR